MPDKGNMKKLILVLLGLVLAVSAEAQTFHTQYKYIQGLQASDGITAPTVTIGTYAAKNVVGQLMSFTNSSCPTTATMQVNSLIITDKSDNAVAYHLYLFDSNPTGTTVTDKNDMTVATADLSKVLPYIATNVADHASPSTTNGFTTLSSLDSGSRVVTTGGILYGVLVTDGAPVFGSTSDIVVRLGTKCN